MCNKRRIRVVRLVAATLMTAGMTTVGAPALADCSTVHGRPKEGDKVYHVTCVACHGEDGRGVVPGAPDFTKKGGVLSEPRAVMEKHIRDGYASPGTPIAMPPMGGNPDMTDQDIDDVHAYLHEKFGCG